MKKQAPKIDSEGRPRDDLGNHAAAFMGHPNEIDKGMRLGSCNVTACQRPNAMWIHSNGKYYCHQCAGLINHANQREPASVWTPLKLDQEALEEHDWNVKNAG
jgi:hypothetical protein